MKRQEINTKWGRKKGSCVKMASKNYLQKVVEFLEVFQSENVRKL